MNQRWLLLLLPFVCATVFGGGPDAAKPLSVPAKQFSHPDRIRYDGHCLTIDGRDTFIYSAAWLVGVRLAPNASEAP